MNERAASYDGSWSSLRSALELIAPVEKPVKTKTGLTTLDGVTIGTLTREQLLAAREEPAAAIHFVAYQGGTHGGSEAA